MDGRSTTILSYLRSHTIGLLIIPLGSIVGACGQAGNSGGSGGSTPGGGGPAAQFDAANSEDYAS